MKKIFGSIFIAMLLLALMAGAVFAGSAAKEKVRFNGTYQAVENDERNPPTVYVHGNGSGDATNLGPFTLHFEGIVHQANGVGTGLIVAHLTMVNGDILFAVGTGLGSASTTPGVNRIVEKFTITGGTGKFENASGEFTEVRMLTLQTGASSSTFEGTVKLAKDK